MNDPFTFPFPTMSGSWAEHFDLITDPPGYGVTVMPGVGIGHGAIITAGAVVTGDVPNHGVASGNPARLPAVAWWDWPVQHITEHQP